MKGKFKNLVFILLLGSGSTLLLLAIRSYSLPRIKTYQEMRLKASILTTAGINYEPGNIEETFRKNIREKIEAGWVYYLSPDGKYIFEFKGRGLWGIIEGVISLEPDLKTIANITIISQEETPGLGGRISEEWFLKQFRGKKVSPRLWLALRRKAISPNEVDAISGASITSQALINMINEAVINFRKVMERKDGSDKEILLH